MTTEIKIYKTDSATWVAAENEIDAMLHMTALIDASDVMELRKEGYPILVEDKELDELVFLENPELGEEESPKTTFRQALKKVIESGVTFPEFFASTEF